MNNDSDSSRPLPDFNQKSIVPTSGVEDPEDGTTHGLGDRRGRVRHVLVRLLRGARELSQSSKLPKDRTFSTSCASAISLAGPGGCCQPYWLNPYVVLGSVELERSWES